MTVQEVVNKLKELGGKSSLSSSDKSSIAALYQEVLGRMFVRTSCSDCYRDAVIEMYSYLRKNGKMKEKSNYALKNGVLLQMNFGSSEMYTNDNLTDEAAEKYLAANPKGISLFSVAPDDWEKRAKERVSPTPKIDEILVSELVSALQVEGATDNDVKEAFKKYQLNGKKVSGKTLELHIKEAKAILGSKDTETSEE